MRYDRSFLLAASLIVAPVATCDQQALTPWPNAPAALPRLSDYGFDDDIPQGQGVSLNGVWKANNSSLASLVEDKSAPVSPSKVAQLRYPVGFRDGSAPATIYIDPEPVREAFFGFVWKASAGFESHPSGVNKLAFIFPAGENGDIYIMMHKTGAGFEICTEPEFTGDIRELCPNARTSAIIPGRWHRIEWYVKYTSAPGARDGISRWWVDGVLNGDYRDLEIAGDRFVEFQFSPTYGGNTGAVKSRTDYFWFDHVVLSGR